MKLSFPITKEKIKTHFTYAWWQYVVFIFASAFLWNLLFTTTHYRSPENMKVEWYYDGYVAQTDQSPEALAEELHRTLLSDMEEVTFTAVTLDATYGPMQLTAWYSAGQGDLLMLPKEYMASLGESGGLVDLAPYIGSGEMKADGTELQNGYVKNSETGERCLVCIPATLLPKLAEYGLALENEYLCVSANCGNVDNAMKLLCWLVENMQE